jgi:hypothetical protein
MCKILDLYLLVLNLQTLKFIKWEVFTEHCHVVVGTPASYYGSLSVQISASKLVDLTEFPGFPSPFKQILDITFSHLLFRSLLTPSSIIMSFLIYYVTTALDRTSLSRQKR